MSHGEAFYKWNEAEKRLDFARDRPQAGPDNGDVRVDGVVSKAQFDAAVAQAASFQRLYEAKSIECAKAQSKLETAERWIASIARQILTSEMDEEDELAADYEGAHNSIIEEARLEVARLQKRVEALEGQG